MNQGFAHCPYCLAQKPELIAQLVGYQVICKNCLATGPNKSFKKQAVRAWNQLTAELDQSRQWHAERFTERLEALEKSLAHSD